MNAIIREQMLSFLPLPVLLSTFFVPDTYIDRFSDPVKQFFMISSLVIVGAYLLLFLLRKKQQVQLRIILPDVLVLFYFAYLVFRFLGTDFNLFSWRALSQELFVLVWYFVFRCILSTQNKTKRAKLLLLGLVIVGLSHAAIGVLQIVGITPGHNSNFSVDGLFGNPTPYTNYLTPIAVLCFYWFLFASRTTKVDKIQRWVAFITFMVIGFVMIISMSRTSWLAVVLSIGAMLLLRFKHVFWYGINKWRLASGIVFVAFLPLLVWGLIGVYKVKRESADGRLLIWKICAYNLDKNVLVGHGYNSFKPTYNNFQATYLKGKNPKHDKEVMLVDNAFHSYNSYLQKYIELGLLGAVLFTSILLMGLISKKENKRLLVYRFSLLDGVKYALLSVLFLGFFSYPFQYPPLYFMCFLFLAIIGVNKPAIYQANIHGGFAKLLAGMAIPLIIYFLSHQFHYNKALKEWRTAKLYLKTGKDDTGIQMYRNCYKQLKYHPEFVYNYGVELFDKGYHTEAVYYLKEILPIMNDTYTHIYLGLCYLQMADSDQAKSHFNSAKSLVPYLLLPRLYLAKIYQGKGDYLQAYNTSRNAVSIPRKVNTARVNSIVNELYSMIDKLEKQINPLKNKTIDRNIN